MAEERIIGHWKLDETSGSTSSDSTSNQNTGTVTGTAIEPGVLGRARVIYPLSQDRIEVGDTDLYRFTDQDFTLSAWIKKTNTPSADVGIITKRDDTSSNNSYSLIINSSGFPAFYASADGTANTLQVTAANSITDGSWHLVTVTRFGQEYALYVDGAPVDSTVSGTAVIFNSTAPLAFGNFSASAAFDRPLDGYIDDVRIYNYELLPAEVNDLFYDTGYDAFAPEFIPVDPVDEQVLVSPESEIIFIYSDEHPDLDTLNVSFNTKPVVRNGIPEDGYFVSYESFSQGFSDGYDGYLVTIEPLSLLPEAASVNVEIDAADAYGSFALFTYSFGTSSSFDPPPKFVNLNPQPNALGHGVSDPIFFQFNDGYDVFPNLISGIDTSTLTAVIDGELAISGGVIQSGFSGSIVANAFDGVNVSITRDAGWRLARKVHVDLSGSDLNGTETVLSYVINMGGGPIVVLESPGDGYIGVERTTDISFEVADATFGIDKDDVSVVINGVNAVSGAIPASGYTVGFTELEDGYIVNITQPTLPEFTEIVVEVTATNRIGEVEVFVFSFETVDETVPLFTPVTPTPSAERVDPETQFIFDFVDGYSGVDAYSLDVLFDGIYVVLDGYATDGYSVEFDPIEDGFRVKIIKDSPFAQLDIVSVDISGYDNVDNFGELLFSFATDDTIPPVVTDRVPDDLEKAFASADVTFSIHDTAGTGVVPELLTVTIDSNPVITNGVFQSGYTGSISSDIVNGFDGYNIIITPDDEFTLDTFQTVSITVKDGYANTTIDVYTFEVADEISPVITNLDPEDLGESSLRPFIRFGIHDTDGTGVNPNNLQMTVDGIPAIVDGEIAPNWAGLVDPTSVNGFDGYNVFVRLNDYFEPGTEHFVIIDGYDIVGNQTTFEYSFFTTIDTIPPTFENFNPEPGETDVPSDTDVFFQFNDFDGYGNLSNINTLTVTIDGNIAVIDGVAVNDYEINVIQNLADGYDVNIDLPSSLPEFHNVVVTIDGYDTADNFASFEYSFRTEDVTVPIVEPILPLAGDVDIGPTNDIIFKVLDGYTGIDLDTLNVSVTGKTAITNGLPVDGYDATITGTLDGYIVELFENDFGEFRVVTVDVSVQDIEGNLKSFSYSFTSADITGPDFDLISPEPFAVEVVNNTDVSFQFIDPHSGPNFDTLNVSIDGSPLIVNGGAAFGIDLSVTPITNGFFVSFSEIVMTEAQEVTIDMDGYDNDGNYSAISYNLTGLILPPFFDPIFPQDGDITLPVDQSVTFAFVDAYGVDIDSLEVFFNGFAAVISGQPLDGYTVTYEPVGAPYAPVLDGYIVEIGHPSFPFNENETIEVDLSGTDNNGIEGFGSFSFKTTSGILPDFAGVVPVPFSTDQDGDTNIVFTIFDPAVNGIILSSIDVYVNLRAVIIDGVPQDGYSVEILPEVDGYTIEIEHDRFEPYSQVAVSIFGTNLDGNSNSFNYFYTLGERNFPDVIPLDPLEGEIDVPRNATICFDVVDATGVDLNGLVVTVNGAVAFRDGSFIPPFDDPESYIEELTELSFEHFSDLRPTYTPVPALFDGTTFTLDLFDEGLINDGYYIDADGYIDFEQQHVSDGYFSIDGYVDGYDGYDGYQLDGYADDGYDGYISIRNAGYRFCLDRAFDYKFNEIVTVNVHAADISGNEGDRQYSFTIITDTGPPIFENISPFPDEEGVSLTSGIFFDFVDIGGSGALLSSLNVTVAGRPAITGGVFQDGYTGGTNFNLALDGYEVEIFANDSWPNYSRINVSLYGEDCVGNSALFDFSFLTDDELAPIFENLFPAPGDIDVPTDTAIRFTFNDSTQSGADISSLDVTILDTPIVLDGVALDGYILEYSANLYDGYDVQIFFPSAISEFTDIEVGLSGRDNEGNFAQLTYSWKTADETPPLFDNIRPIFPDAKISITDPIFVDIFEPASGLDIGSVGVTVDGISVIDSGIVQPNGFVAELTEIQDGYRLYVQSVGPLPHDVDLDTTALWRMDESGITSVDNATGNASLDGLAIGPTDVAGKFGNARRFVATDDRIIVGTDSELELQDFAIEAWVNPSSLTGDHVVYNYNPRQTITRGRGVVLRVTSTGALKLSLGNGTTIYSDISTASGLIPTGSYTHVAAIVSQTRSTVTLMVNGAVEQTAVYPITAVEYSDDVSGAPLTGTVLIGNRINPLTGSFIDAFVGDIDDVRVSGASRSVSSVANSFNRSLSVAFGEFAVVPVSIFARDNSGNDGYIDYTFVTLDETPPIFSDFNPDIDSVRNDLNSNVRFSFTDLHSGPDLDTLNVTVNGLLLVSDGTGLLNTIVSTAPVVDGYEITLDLDFLLPEYENIVVTLDGYDIDPNRTTITYQFSTDDITPPDIANELPVPGSVQVNPYTDILFDIHDFNGSGVALSALNVQIDDRDAILDGVAQEGWDVGIVPTFVDGYDGYSFHINPDVRFALDSDIRVLVDGYDAYGNQLITDYSFHTFVDDTAPEIVRLDPAPFATQVALYSDVTFDIVDGYDVDLSRLDVSVDNMPAIIDGVFQPGYSGLSSSIVAIGTNVELDGYDGYNVVIDPEFDFFYNHQVTVVVDGYDFSDNHVHFEYFFNTVSDTDGPLITNKDPDADEIEVELDSDVSFDITDLISGVNMERLDVHIDSIPVMINGVHQSGWDGPSSGIEVIPDGYRVVFDPEGVFDFDFNQVHAVTVDGYDFADNHTNEVYSFATIADPNPPALSNFNPSPGVDEVPVDTNISFDITDTPAGVDMTRLNVTVNDVLAITEGELTFPFDDVSSAIVPILDGYSITLDLFVDFGYNELQTVIIDGYDFAENHLLFGYTFLTKVDVNGPTIIPIDPEDSVGDISRTTDIVMRAIDLETGVDFDRFDVTIDNTLVMQDGEFIVGTGFDGPYSQVIQRADGYDVTFDSTITFPPSHTVRVVVDGYDLGDNHTHFEYIFATIDDAGPYVFDFHPTPNSVDAENDPVHISFGIRDAGEGEVNINSLLIEVSVDDGEPFTTLYEPIEEFQNGWSGVINNQLDGDGYYINAFKVDQGESFALYTVRITAEDDSLNQTITTIGRTGGLIEAGTGLVTSPTTLDVGEFFINSNQVEEGDIIIIQGIGAREVDGYTTDEIVVNSPIGATGAFGFSLYRGSFMLERRIFKPAFAESTSFTTVDLTFNDPPQIVGTVLDPAAYVISGGDYPIVVVGVSQVDDDTFELTLDVPMQASPVLYTATVDTDGIINEWGFSIDDGYESVDYLGISDTIGSKVVQAFNEPFNVNVTVVFDEAMLQNSELTNPNNYLLSHGAYVTAATADPTELDRVILWVENLYGRQEFDVFVVSDKIRDVFGNPLDLEFNHTLVNLEVGPALSGITGRVRSRNAVRRLYEDSRNWYLATEGGIDVVSKAELENKGYVLDGYGFNAITADIEDIYFGRSDGYESDGYVTSTDGYGVSRLSFNDLNANSTLRVTNAYSTSTVPAILSNEVNDLFTITHADDGLLAVATNASATLIKNADSAVQYSPGNEIKSVQMDDGGQTLYIANNTLGRVEVYYNTNLDTTDKFEPDAYYSVFTSPEISDSTINQIKITNNTSIIDDDSNSIYVATNDGLTIIHTDESSPGASEGGGISLIYGVAGSGATFEIVGGEVSRVIAVDINLNKSQIFVATDDPSHKGGVTTINIPSNTQFQFASDEIGTLVSNDLRDLVFKNL